MKALVGTFNQEKALVGAFSVIRTFGWNFLKHYLVCLGDVPGGVHPAVGVQHAAVDTVRGGPSVALDGLAEKLPKIKQIENMPKCQNSKKNFSYLKVVRTLQMSRRLVVIL